MKREIRFEPGHDCIRFACKFGSTACAPGKGGSHGVHGMQIRWLVIGDAGAVQFLLFTGWLPEPENLTIPPLPADLGYHSPVPRYEGQTPQDNCDVLPGGTCYYDGSGLNALEPFRVLCNSGGEALWQYLETYYRATFEDGIWPEKSEYEWARRVSP